MFNYGVFRKTLEDSLLSLVLTAIFIIAFVCVFVWAMLNMGEQLFEFVAKVPFIARIFEMSFGIQIDGQITPSVLYSICFTHGIVLALTWTAIIATATRVTAGEVERGTADVLMTMPLNRREVYFSTSVVWMLIAIVLSFCPVVGLAIADTFLETDESVKFSVFLLPAINFVFLNLAVGGIATMIGAILNRRGFAVGATVGLVLLSVVLNFLAPFLTQFKAIGWLSLLAYFRPTDVVRTNELPLLDCGILLAVAVICWGVGLVVFSKKDIPTG